MAQRFGYNGARSGIALGTVSVIAVLWVGTAHAQIFNSVDFEIATKSNEAQEVSAGDLICSWRESGLGPYSAITYNCSAEAVATVFACVYKNRIISDTVAVSAYNLSSLGHGGEAEAFLANNSGRINGSTTISLEQVGGPETHQLCPNIGESPGEGGQEPAVEAVAVRYCNMALEDTTNGIVGGTQSELFEVLQRGTYTVPSCGELLSGAPQ